MRSTAKYNLSKGVDMGVAVLVEQYTYLLSESKGCGLKEVSTTVNAAKYTW